MVTKRTKLAGGAAQKKGFDSFKIIFSVKTVIHGMWCAIYRQLLGI